MKNNRIYYFDILKILAIYLVCLYHFGRLEIDFLKSNQYHIYINYIFYSLSSIGVPLFLMVNGALLLNREYEIKKHIFKTLSIGGLFLFWGAVTLIILVPIFGDHYSPIQFLKSVYYIKDGRIDHLWFLIALIYIYLLFPLLKGVFDKNNIAVISYVTAMIALFTFGINLLNNSMNIFGYLFNKNAFKFINLNKFIGLNPFNLFYSYTLVYFILGGIMARKIKSINLNNTICTVIFSLSWLLLFLFGYFKSNIKNEVFDVVWNGYDTIMTLTMTVSIFVLFSRIKIENVKLKNMIATVSSNTLGIYFVHIPIGFWLTNYFEKLPISKYLVFNLCYVLILLIVSLLVTLILKKIPIINKMVRI